MNADLSWDEFRLVKAVSDSRCLGGAAEGATLDRSTFPGRAERRQGKLVAQYAGSDGSEFGAALLPYFPVDCCRS